MGLKEFEDAFDDRVGSSVRDCACGRVFYNPDPSGWDWEDGELDRLEANGATAVDYAIGALTFEGQTFADACDCWIPRATKIAAWLDAHAEEIAEYLMLEKKRKQHAADDAPVVR